MAIPQLAAIKKLLDVLSALTGPLTVIAKYGAIAAAGVLVGFELGIL